MCRASGLFQKIRDHEVFSRAHHKLFCEGLDEDDDDKRTYVRMERDNNDADADARQGNATAALLREYVRSAIIMNDADARQGKATAILREKERYVQRLYSCDDYVQ